MQVALTPDPGLLSCHLLCTDPWYPNNRCKIATDNPKKIHHNNVIRVATDTMAMSHRVFSGTIITAGMTKTALLVVQSRGNDDWLPFSLNDLAHIIAEQNNVLNALQSTNTHPLHSHNHVRHSPPTLKTCEKLSPLVPMTGNISDPNKCWRVMLMASSPPKHT
jgi:hypothetical protein